MRQSAFILWLMVSIPCLVMGHNDDSLYLVNNYSKAEYQIPMRDGVKLFTIVYSPVDKRIKYPVLLNRTPYNVEPYGQVMNFSFRRGLSPVFLREGFIFVFQDVRGRFMSEGTFHHMTSYIDTKMKNDDVDEGSDAYDTMDWLMKNLNNHNGKIGMWGISYPGYYASCAAINAHPALKCVSPQAPIADWYFDDVHHHGAFFLSPNFDFFAAMDLPRHGFTKDWILPFKWKTPDGYAFFKDLEPLNHAKTKYFGDSIGFWNDITAHPDYDDFWQTRNILPHLKNIKPAILVVGGWFDAEDLYGTFKTYKTIENNNPGIRNSIVIGPWIHGGWARTDGSFLGNVSFSVKTSEYYRDSIELPFFNYYLKDKGTMTLAEAMMFMTGRNLWKRFKTWPPKTVDSRKLFLSNHETLTFSPTLSNTSSYDEFISDPKKPVPYTQDIYFTMTKEYMTDDQRFASQRPDVLVYKTDILQDDLVLAGPITAHLKVSTSGSDADWVVKLIDVYPDSAQNNVTTRQGTKMAGYQQMVRSEILRGRYRNGYVKAEPFIPGKIADITLELQDVLHCFKKGHRLMVQVQSTWFPLVDLNPQKFVNNIFEARDDDFIKATHRVYHEIGNESYLEIGVLVE